jgi:hypothetical protein
VPRGSLCRPLRSGSPGTSLVIEVMVVLVHIEAGPFTQRLAPL